ncbi:MAG: hypothetical protein JRD68_07505 [Deltaproteobacteria bacterium]|nr:hypothetical protein [Deltaproteobacteria bacterium]
MKKERLESQDEYIDNEIVFEYVHADYRGRIEIVELLFGHEEIEIPVDFSEYLLNEKHPLVRKCIAQNINAPYGDDERFVDHFLNDPDPSIRLAFLESPTFYWKIRNEISNWLSNASQIERLAFMRNKWLESPYMEPAYLDYNDDTLKISKEEKIQLLSAFLTNPKYFQEIEDKLYPHMEDFDEGYVYYLWHEMGTDISKFWDLAIRSGDRKSYELALEKIDARAETKAEYFEQINRQYDKQESIQHEKKRFIYCGGCKSSYSNVLDIILEEDDLEVIEVACEYIPLHYTEVKKIINKYQNTGSQYSIERALENNKHIQTRVFEDIYKELPDCSLAKDIIEHRYMQKGW